MNFYKGQTFEDMHGKRHRITAVSSKTVFIEKVYDPPPCVSKSAQLSPDDFAWMIGVAMWKDVGLSQ